MEKDFMGSWNMSKCLFCKFGDSLNGKRLKEGRIICLKKKEYVSKDSYCDKWRYKF